MPERSRDRPQTLPSCQALGMVVDPQLTSIQTDKGARRHPGGALVAVHKGMIASSAAIERAWQSESRSVCRRHRRSLADTTRQFDWSSPGRHARRDRTGRHAATGRRALRHASGGDVNDPNWTCCSISAVTRGCTKGREGLFRARNSIRLVPTMVAAL